MAGPTGPTWTTTGSRTMTNITPIERIREFLNTET